MNWTLANSALLPLAALVAVPVLVHLFARIRPRSMVFSSIDFIQRVVRSQMSFKRPQDWLLLILRTLLAAALITLFLQPTLLSPKETAAITGNRSVVLVIDATASMNYPEGMQTRFAAACSAASRQLAGLGSGDRANIIWLKANPEGAFPEPGSNLSHLQELLRRARCTQETGVFAPALTSAISQLASAPGAKEIVVFSDFQASTWSDASFAVPAGVTLSRKRIGSGPGVNGAITAVHIDPPRPLVSDSVNLLVEAANFSTEPSRRTVFLEMADQRQSQEITIPAQSRASAIFRVKMTAAGITPGVISLNEDTFVTDDRRWVVVPVKDSIRVGLFAGDPAQAAAWSRALAVLPWARVQRLTVEELGADLPYDVLFLSGFEEKIVDKVRQQAAVGGITIVCAPRPESSAAAFARLAGLPETSEPFRWQALKERMSAEVSAKKDPLFALFASNNFGNPASGMVRGHLTVPTSNWPELQTLIRYADGTPALARSTSTGPIYLWNIPLDPAQSDWAAKASFVPLLGELLLQSQNRHGSEAAASDVEPGSAATLKLSRNTAAGMQFLDPNGESLPLQSEMDARGGTRFVSGSLPAPGLYTWKLRDRVVDYTTVHFPTVESDMRPVEKFSDGTTATPLQAADLMTAPQRESPLWPTLLLIAIALLCLESGVVFWTRRKA